MGAHVAWTSWIAGCAAAVAWRRRNSSSSSRNSDRRSAAAADGSAKHTDRRFDRARHALLMVVLAWHVARDVVAWATGHGDQAAAAWWSAGAVGWAAVHGAWLGHDAAVHAHGRRWDRLAWTVAASMAHVVHRYRTPHALGLMVRARLAEHESRAAWAPVAGPHKVATVRRAVADAACVWPWVLSLGWLAAHQWTWTAAAYTVGYLPAWTDAVWRRRREMRRAATVAPPPTAARTRISAGAMHRGAMHQHCL